MDGRPLPASQNSHPPHRVGGGMYLLHLDRAGSETSANDCCCLLATTSTFNRYLIPRLLHTAHRVLCVSVFGCAATPRLTTPRQRCSKRRVLRVATGKPLRSWRISKPVDASRKYLRGKVDNCVGQRMQFSGRACLREIVSKKIGRISTAR